MLENLKLFEGENLIRTAILMFHSDPEKWVTGAYIKIGYFGDSDLRYQDVVHGAVIYWENLWQPQNVISIDCVKLEFWNRKVLTGVHIMNGNEPISEPINY